MQQRQAGGVFEIASDPAPSINQSKMLGSHGSRLISIPGSEVKLGQGNPVSEAPRRAADQFGISFDRFRRLCQTKCTGW